MEGNGEPNQQHYGIYHNEEEQDQDESFLDVPGFFHGASSSHHLHQLGTSNDDEGVRLVSSFSEPSHDESASHDTINLNPQERGRIRLSLRKSTSLINLLEKTLTQERDQRMRRENFLSQPCSEKLKASNFPAIYLEIGSWSWVSINGGDLVAKIYYAKKKLVWEFLFGPLKKKIEISWSEISAINAFISEGKNGRLQIELNEPPEFGQEIKNQPRKHTQWAATTDFTGDQALICRRHTVEFSPGVLDKHFDKLLQCNNRLLNLSRQPFPSHNSPFFPNACFNFSYNGDVKDHQQAFHPHAQHLVRPTSPLVGHSSSSLPSSASKVLHVNRNHQMQKTILSIPMEEEQQQRPPPPFHGVEAAWVRDQHLQFHLQEVQNLFEFSTEQNCFRVDLTNCEPFDQQQQRHEGNYQIMSPNNGGNGIHHFGYTNNDVALQEHSYWWPIQDSTVDDGNSGVNDGICSVDQWAIHGRLVMEEPDSWSPAQINKNYQDQRWTQQ